AIALYFTDSGSNISVKSVVCGLLIGLTLDIHPNGVLYAPAIAGMYLLDYGWSFVRVKRFWGFVIGGCAGVAYFVATHILPYPQTYFALARLGLGESRTPPILNPDLGVWQQSFTDALRLSEMFGNVFIMVAFVVLLRRWSASDKRLLVLYAALALGFAAVIRQKAD